jgi:tetratricopeptide (TPR) repeat protein
MKKFTTSIFAVLLAASSLSSQILDLPPASKKARVSEWIGLTEVTIDYHRPGVKGREGKVYGKGNIVDYNGGHPIPWRAGADENTTVYFGTDVTIEGKALKAGKYGFHVIPAENEWTLIFSKDFDAWGSFFYKPENDALRVTVKPQASEMTEWLTYEFVNQTDNSADVRLRWERKLAAFKVETDLFNLTLANVENQLTSSKGFNWMSYVAAAQWLLQQNRNLDKALEWADRAISPNFGGTENFSTLSLKAQVLDKLGRTEESKALLEKAFPRASMTELHFYARSLIADNKPKEAMKVFQKNREQNPQDNFTTLVGLARGNMAMGNFKEAAQYFKQASPNAPAGQAQVYLDLAKECEAKLKSGG